jgi:hypothetical protein
MLDSPFDRRRIPLGTLSQVNSPFGQHIVCVAPQRHRNEVAGRRVRTAGVGQRIDDRVAHSRCGAGRDATEGDIDNPPTTAFEQVGDGDCSGQARERVGHRV